MDLLFLHGLGQTPSSWDQTIQRLPGEWEIRCPDLACWLQGQEPSYPLLYHALESYCDQFDQPLALCGLSLGGVLVLQYVTEHPEKVSSFVLIGAQYTMPKRLLQLQSLIFRFLPDAMFQNMGFSKREFLHLSRSMMDLDFKEALPNIQSRGLILCGERDSANRSASLELAERIPQSQLVLLPKTGHEVNVEAPEALGAILSSFFQEPL